MIFAFGLVLPFLQPQSQPLFIFVPVSDCGDNEKEITGKKDLYILG